MRALQGLCGGLVLLGLSACGATAPSTDRVPTAGPDGGPLPEVEAEYLTNERKSPEKPAPAVPRTETLGAFRPIEGADEGALRAFHQALDRAARGEGKARVLFYGASHVAGDLFVREVRRALQARYGHGGRGFVMPVAPWKYYRPEGVAVSPAGRRWRAGWVTARDPEPGHYGYGGLYVEARKPGAVGTIEWGGGTVAPARVELLYLAQPGGGAFEVIFGGRVVERVKARAPVPREARVALEVPEGATGLSLRTTAPGTVRIFGALLEGEGGGVVVDTLGVNGARAKNQLLWDDAAFRASLAARDPALVVLAYGTNESGDDDVPLATLEAEVTQVVARVKEAAPNASCVLIGPSDRPLRDEAGAWVARPRTVEVTEVQRRVARASGCGFFDLAAFMGGPLSMTRWVAHDPPLGAEDHVHLTAPGYARLGQALTAALLEGAPTPPTN